MDPITMGVLGDAGVFGPLQAPTPNGAGATMAAAPAGLSINAGAGVNGTAYAMLAALALLGVVYWRTRGLQH